MCIIALLCSLLLCSFVSFPVILVTNFNFKRTLYCCSCRYNVMRVCNFAKATSGLVLSLRTLVGNRYVRLCVSRYYVPTCTYKMVLLQCFDAVGWVTGRASGL